MIKGLMDFQVRVADATVKDLYCEAKDQDGVSHR